MYCSVSEVKIEVVDGAMGDKRLAQTVLGVLACSAMIISFYYLASWTRVSTSLISSSSQSTLASMTGIVIDALLRYSSVGISGTSGSS